MGWEDEQGEFYPWYQTSELLQLDQTLFNEWQWRVYQNGEQLGVHFDQAYQDRVNAAASRLNGLREYTDVQDQKAYDAARNQMMTADLNAALATAKPGTYGVDVVAGRSPSQPTSSVTFSRPTVEVHVGGEKKDWKVEVIDSGVLGGAVFPTLDPLNVSQFNFEKWLNKANDLSDALLTVPNPGSIGLGELLKAGTIGAKGLLKAGKTVLQAEKAADVAKASGSAAEVVLQNINTRNVITKTAEETNQWWKAKGLDNPPVREGTKVMEAELREETSGFVRVYDDVNSFQKGGWLMRKEDIIGLTPEQIKDKFALKYVPKYVTDVKLPADTKIRISEANEITGWGKGGGTQIDLLDERVGEFFNPRALEGKWW